jgi:PLP dependent protein
MPELSRGALPRRVRALFGTSFYDSGLTLDDTDLVSRLEAVEARIRAAVERSGRSRAEITLVAVTKKFSADKIRQAYRAGLREFGENYVQEFADKQPDLGDLPEARFHLIGHLQSNKARLACQLFHVIESVDSPKLIPRLDAAATERTAPMEIMLELKLSAEENKAGADPKTLGALLEEASRGRHLVVTGLMTVPPWSTDAEESRPYFRELARLGKQFGLPKLSMGMSNDFEVAIEEGATSIRVGTAIFGARPKPERQTQASHQ